MDAKLIIILLLCLALAGCEAIKKRLTTPLSALDHPPTEVRARINRYLPAALDWHNQSEQQLYTQGRRLTVPEQVIARQMGVAQPQNVRVLVTPRFPLPIDPELRRASLRYGIGNPLEGGRTMGYVILIKPNSAQDKTVLAHELVHVGQIERLGKPAFLQRYLTELEMVTYARSPLEREAYRKEKLVK